MSLQDEEKVEKRYYSIGEVADLLEINRSMLRFWEQEFPKLAPRKTRSGRRMYTPEDIKLVKRIHYLVKEKKYTLEGAREHLKDGSTELDALLETRETLLKVKKLLLHLREHL